MFYMQSLWSLFYSQTPEPCVMWVNRFPTQCLEKWPQWTERCFWHIVFFPLSLSSEITTWHSYSHNKCLWHVEVDCKGSYYIKLRLTPSHLLAPSQTYTTEHTKYDAAIKRQRRVFTRSILHESVISFLSGAALVVGSSGQKRRAVRRSATENDFLLSPPCFSNNKVYFSTISPPITGWSSISLTVPFITFTQPK